MRSHPAPRPPAFGPSTASRRVDGVPALGGFVRSVNWHRLYASGVTALGWLVLLACGYALPVGLHLIIEALKEMF